MFFKNYLWYPTLVYILESVVISLLFMAAYIYFNFIYLLGDFSYFSLFFLHVPIAWISSLNYIFIIVISLSFLLTNNLYIFSLAIFFIRLGVLYTMLTIFTGMLWGLPIWGILFVWDARFVTVLVLLCLYFLYATCFYLAEKGKLSYRLVAFLMLVGSLNLPLIKYSVEWWNTLHQVSSLTQLYSTVHFSVLLPLFVYFLVFLCFYLLLVLYNLRIAFFTFNITLFKYFVVK